MGYSVEQLSDLEAIRDVAMPYAHGVDRLDAGSGHSFEYGLPGLCRTGPGGGKLYSDLHAFFAGTFEHGQAAHRVSAKKS